MTTNNPPSRSASPSLKPLGWKDGGQMSNQNWTPEPWTYDIVNHVISDADIYRIIACVNACAGMEEPEKEIAKLRESNNIQTFARLVVEKKVLRDALDQAIDGMEDMIGYVPEYFRNKWKHDDCITKAREALAKTERKDGE